VPIVDACRASLAAPLYFRSVEIDGFEGSFRDAGLLEIDPAFEAYNEVRHLRGPDSGGVQFLLSIGTGRPNPPHQRARKQHQQHQQHASEKPLSDRADVLEDEADKHNFDYIRFIRADSDLPPVSNPQSIPEVRKDAHKYCSSVRSDLQRWASLLVQGRRDRARTVKWDRYAGLRIPCAFCGKTFERAKLIEHITRDHGTNMPKVELKQTLYFTTTTATATGVKSTEAKQWDAGPHTS
jgi:hypothetical protein